MCQNKNIFQERIIHKECCVDFIYSNLNYTHNRMLYTRMKEHLNVAHVSFAFAAVRYQLNN
jgi:hypothetical protein